VYTIEKSFDNVQQNKLFEIVKRIGIKFNDKRFIYSKYKNQIVLIQIDGKKKKKKKKDK
jgi:hypothetical protein